MPLPIFQSSFKPSTASLNIREISRGFCALLCGAGLSGFGPARGESPTAAQTAATAVPAAAPTAVSQLGNLYVREYRVRGNKILKAIEIEEAVYPFMGPGRGEQDIEGARMALEKIYKAKGYQSVGVQVPQQTGARGVIYLEVVETPVGRLRVKGARYFLPSKIKEMAPSMKEGTVPNFNEISKDIVALNRWRDRKITPELRAGVVPGTVDIDLIVDDKLPAHGSWEINNQHNANTVPLRLSGSLSYSNLWQMGHTLGASFQIAPEKMTDSAVYSAFYQAPIHSVEGLSTMLTGTIQDSNIAALGGTTVIGKGQIVGFRLMKTLPAKQGYFHSISFGIDYKNFVQDVNAGGALVSSPIAYYPFNLAYSGSRVTDNTFTEFNAALTWHVMGMGGSQTQFAARRFAATDSFFYFRGDLSHTHDVAQGFQIYTRVQGQATPDALINTEQTSGGGYNTARGYLIATRLGDSGIFGSLEFRSPNFLGTAKDRENQWRVYAFLEGGKLYTNKTLPAEKRSYDLASAGFGTRIRYLNHITGSVDLAMPLVSQPNALAHDLFLLFRLGMDF